MDCYLYDGERLVFESEGWGIIVDEGSTKRKTLGRTAYATHQACTLSFTRSMLKHKGDNGALNLDEDEYVYGERCWHKRSSTLTCIVCAALVPEGIQALILLQTWEKCDEV